MPEQSFEELLNEQESVRIHNGSIVTGKVIDVKENAAVLNIGYKADGILTKSEFSDDPAADMVSELNVGDEIEVKVLRVNDGDGQVSLTYKRLSEDRNLKELEKAFEEQTVLTGTVSKVVKGGLSVDYKGSAVFIPASLVSDVFERDLNKYMDKEVEFILIECKRRRIVGDRKQVVAAQKQAALQELLSRVSEGMIVTGKVKNITEFGAFIDLGGADGLLHISEMTWGRIDNAKKIYKSGDEVEAYIKSIDPETGKIGLSVKFPDKNPWGEDSIYAAGNTVTGKVARMTDYGAFVELEPGIDALLHVSQIAHERVGKPSDVLKAGQEITAQVIELDPVERRISISMKALLPAPEKEEPEEVKEAEETAAPEKEEEHFEVPIEVPAVEE